MPLRERRHNGAVRVAAWWVIVMSGASACSEPGHGGGAFGDTMGDVDTRDAVFFPETDDATDVAETVDTALPETVDTALPETVDTALPETVDTVETLDTTPAETVQAGACTYHTDCYPERVCGRWFKDGSLRCSDPCAGDTDCGAGQICSKVPGSIQVGYCQDGPPGLTNGEPCSFDADCRSRLCADNMCVPLCLDEAHCAQPGMTCHPSGDLAIGWVTSVCAPDPANAIALGQECTPDGLNYDGGYCASGHCDLLSLTSNVCAPVCKSESDCAPALECNIVIGAEVEAADAVPYDPLFTQKTHDAVSACYSPLTSGSFADGTPCSERGQCRSNKCLPLLPDSNQTYCTGFCTKDAQCPANMACKLEVLNLSSEWLAAAGTSAPGSWSFVRVCKFR